MVRRGLLRVFNEEGPTFNDNEENFSDLEERIKKNITILKNIHPEKMIKAENEKIEFRVGEKEFKFKNLKEYLFIWIFTNFFFHMTTTYNILKSKGVVLGRKFFEFLVFLTT